MSNLGVSGLASGFDWKSLITQLADVDRAPERVLQTEQNKLAQQNNAYSGIQTELTILQNRISTLKSPDLYQSRQASVSDTTAGLVAAGTGTGVGNYSFNILQLATTAQQTSASSVARKLNATNDVSGLTLSGAGFAQPVTAGTITVNGKQVSIALTDSLKDVFDRISTATSGAVTGAYDASTDKITFSSASEIVLGSSADTSNLLQLARLSNNGSGTVTSGSTLGGIRLSSSLTSANFGTAVSDGGSGAGAFKINGVSFSFSATADSVQAVLDKINNSAAGVTATYNASTGKFQLANQTTGDIGIALEDVTGNFLAASGLSGGTLTHGKDLQYQLNGGPTLSSHSNIITADSSGVTGLSVTALKEGTTFSVGVSVDTATIKSAIQSFVTQYNQVQNVIDRNTQSSTDSTGKVTASLLSGDTTAYELSRSLRTMVGARFGSGTLSGLADLGIDTSGDNNLLTTTDATKLDTALSGNLAGIQRLFTDGTSGIATKFNTYLNNTIGDGGDIVGTLVDRQSRLTKQSTDITTQIANLEKMVTANSDRLTQSFLAMETAQANINQQLAYIQKNFA
jgi:flagellar hook-associated protein 2